MDKFVIVGGKKINGTASVSGAKNVALKALVAACLTDQEVIIHNVPLISDLHVMTEIIEELGGNIVVKDHTIRVTMKNFSKTRIALDRAAHIRTSSMFMSPLLARCGEAIIPNPGGCRIGARPIDRTISGLIKMGATISYQSEDGYFHATASKKGNQYLTGTRYTFDKNSHTGTETLLLAAVLGKGETILENAAQEPEVDQLIQLLNSMGAHIERVKPRTLVIEGVEKLSGTEFTIAPDRNEIVTIALAAIMTGGDVTIHDARKEELEVFLQKLDEAGGGYEVLENAIRFYSKGPLKATNIITSPHPGFMTDWQGPWSVCMTIAQGESIIHEAVYENRFGYVGELRKMGAKIELFNPPVEDPKTFYNFNEEDDNKKFLHAAKVKGPVKLHNGVVEISDLRAGATLVLAALAAKGESVIFGIEHLDRGYEQFENRLTQLGAEVKRISEE